MAEIEIYKGGRSDLWKTPKSLFEKLNKQYDFCIDLAACEESALTKRYFSESDCALLADWNFNGTAWLNPPYSIADKFFAKCVSSKKKIVAIYKATNLESKLWQDLIFENASWVFFIKTRVQYEGAGSSAPFGSALIGFNVESPIGIDGRLFFIQNKETEIPKVKFSRHWAMPNRHTFKMKPIKELIDRYNDNNLKSIDPFAGFNSPANETNDLNKEAPTKYHMLAVDFCKTFDDDTFDLAFFDPPYSHRQITECYKSIGLKAFQTDTQSSFYSKVKDILCKKIKPGGIIISFGWTSSQFGTTRGFEIIEIMLVAHGGGHYDTIVTVEKRIK